MSRGSALGSEAHRTQEVQRRSAPRSLDHGFHMCSSCPAFDSTGRDRGRPGVHADPRERQSCALFSSAWRWACRGRSSTGYPGCITPSSLISSHSSDPSKARMPRRPHYGPPSVGGGRRVGPRIPSQRGAHSPLHDMAASCNAPLHARTRKRISTTSISALASGQCAAPAGTLRGPSTSPRRGLPGWGRSVRTGAVRQGVPPLFPHGIVSVRAAQRRCRMAGVGLAETAGRPASTHTPRHR